MIAGCSLPRRMRSRRAALYFGSLNNPENKSWLNLRICKVASESRPFGRPGPGFLPGWKRDGFGLRTTVFTVMFAPDFFIGSYSTPTAAGKPSAAS